MRLEFGRLLIEPEHALDDRKGRRALGDERARLVVLLPDVDIGSEGGVAGVGDEAVGGLDIRRRDDGLHRRRRAEEAQPPHGLTADAGIRIDGFGDEPLLGVGKPAALVGEHPRGRGPRVGHRRFEQPREQPGVDCMKALLQPQHLGGQPLGGRVRRDAAEPGIGRGEHVCLRPGLEFGTSPVAGAPFGASQLLEHLVDRPARLRLGLQERLVFIHEPVDAAVDVVAIGIALAVLHVTDERVGPVAKPQRAVGADLRIDGAKVLVGALDEVEGGLRITRIVPHPLPLEAAAVVGECPARDAVHVDHASVDELVLHLVRELPRAQKLASYDGPHALGVEDRAHALAASILLARERRVPVLCGARAVAADALTPFVEHVAPGVAVAGRVEVGDLPGARVEHIGAR